MPVGRRVGCKRAVLVVAHARHAYGMVNATTGRERRPTRIGAAVRTVGCGMVDLGIRTLGTRHTTSDQQSREENVQTFGGRVAQRDEYGVSVPWMFFSWSPVRPSKGERRQRETHGSTSTLSRSSSCGNASGKRREEIRS